MFLKQSQEMNSSLKSIYQVIGVFF